jgi:hypothetical protein
LIFILRKRLISLRVLVYYVVQVGSDFGASITHELSRIIFFAIESEFTTERQSIYILLFQQTESAVVAADEEGGVFAPHHQAGSGHHRGTATSSAAQPLPHMGAPLQPQRAPPQERSTDRPTGGIQSEF